MAASPAIYSCPGLMSVTGLTVGKIFSLIVAESDVAEQVERYGAGLTLLEWASRLRCGECGSREVDSVVCGGRR